MKSIIELHNVEIKRGKKCILENINITIEKGEFIYLIGSVGSGKTSLLSTLYGELPINKGEGRIIYYQLDKISKKEIPFLRRKLGIIFQDYRLLLDRNVYENLLFVLKSTGWTNMKSINKKIAQVIQKVGLADKIENMPSALSGGEQQRVAIARAILNSPEVIIADEPTGNLDPTSALELMNLLRDITIKNGTTVIMSTHNYNLIKKFEGRVLECKNQTIVECASV